MRKSLTQAFYSAAWTTFGTELKITNTWAWRIPSALQALPAVLQVALIFFCPESPRWLVNKGREDQALQTLAYYHADGNTYVLSSCHLSFEPNSPFLARILLYATNLRKSKLLSSSTERVR